MGHISRAITSADILEHVSQGVHVEVLVRAVEHDRARLVAAIAADMWRSTPQQEEEGAR
jgi:hypothetical protein